MSYFDNDHLKISDLIIDFEENISIISNLREKLLNINNIEEFNNLRTELYELLKNTENETNILINTLKIIQFNIRKLYDDYAKNQCNYEDAEIRLKAKINDNHILLNKNKEIEKQIKYKNQIIEEQNKHILELIKSKKNNDILLKDLKNQIQDKNKLNEIKNNKRNEILDENKTINNDKIIHYQNFINMKKNFNKNLRNIASNLTEENNKINIKRKLVNNYKNDLSETQNIKSKNVTLDNEKYIFRDDLEHNDEEIDNNVKNKTTINNSTKTFKNKKETSVNNIFNINKKNNSNNKMIYENTKDKILNKRLEDKATKKLKRKGQSAKNIHKIKNFEFDIGNNITKYFLFNLQREKIINNKNSIKLIRQKTPKYKN